MSNACRFWATAVAAAIVSVSAGTARSETIVRKSTSYFHIGGKTAAEIDEELTRKGPMTQMTGNRHPGATQIRFGGDLTYIRKGERCAIEDARVTLDTKIILPRWKNRKRATKELGFIWDALSADIKRHEERHAEIARQYARDLEKALKRLPTQDNCDKMQDKVAEVTDRITLAHDEAQMKFDRIEAKNFQNRMARILRYKSGRVSQD
ncbi:DUF922 domain-containing protein [Rhizobium sp. 18065]|uniref:DUF922 domain-containing Zn-dependent protease n=1 Tax=Rhizobium sp. 18065 TaxID=2681411 RepID=UPI0013571216|nr:DUF922 domain-containing protein [Rhizobium sp. 18065]